MLLYTAPHLQPAESKSRDKAFTKAAFSSSTCWTTCVLHHHEVERGGVWEASTSLVREIAIVIYTHLFLVPCLGRRCYFSYLCSSSLKTHHSTGLTEHCTQDCSTSAFTRCTTSSNALTAGLSSTHMYLNTPSQTPLAYSSEQFYSKHTL